jgi:hypothetical protein
VLDRLSLLITHSASSFLSFHPIPVFSLLVPTSESRHHFSLSRGTPDFPLSYTLLLLLVVSGFFDSLPSFLLVLIFLPFIQLYIHIFLLLSIFPLLHCHTRSSGSTSSSPCSFSFLYSIPSVSYTLPYHPFCPQTLPLSFPLSLSAYSSWTPFSSISLFILSLKINACNLYPVFIIITLMG